MSQVREVVQERTRGEEPLQMRKDDLFYPIPEEDGKKLLKYFEKKHLAGEDTDGWYFWFVGFMGAPMSINQIDELMK